MKQFIKNILIWLGYGIILGLASICIIYTGAAFLGYFDHGNVRKTPTTETIFLDTNRKLVSFTIGYNKEVYILTREMNPEDKVDSYTLYNPDTKIPTRLIINEARIH